MSENRLIERTFQGIYYTSFLQIFTRILTFSCNIYIAKISSFGLLGSLQDFDLIHSTLLFLSRESIRMALLRNSSSEKVQEKHQLVVNMSFIPFLSFLVLTAPATLFISSASFSYPLALYVVAAGIELITEPFYVYCQSRLLYDIRLKVEGFAFISQCVTTLAGCYLIRDHETGLVSEGGGAIIYGAAFVVFAVCLLFGYLYHVSKHLSFVDSEGKKAGMTTLLAYFTPRRVLSQSQANPILFDAYLAKIFASFIFQTIIKHLLTVADKLVLVGMGVANEQKGSYKLVSDLGSLVARIIFLPIEESSRAFFAQSLTNTEYKLANLEKSLQFLKTIVKFHILFGSLFVFFAPNYTSILLSILYSKASIESSSLLSLYCCYVPFLGVNGVAEAFLQGVGGADILNSQMLYMCTFWIAYLATSYISIVMLKLSSYGLVISNIVNMSLRIWFSFRFIFLFYGKGNRVKIYISDFIPGSLGLFICLLLSFFITQESAKFFSIIAHIAVGTICLFATLTIFYWTERHRWIQDFLNIRK